MLTQEECIGAGLAAGGILYGDKLVLQNRREVPSGCFIWKGDNVIYFNINPSGEEALYHASICKFKLEGVLQARKASRCPLGSEYTQEECIFAGMTAGGTLVDFNLVKGDWDDKPSGCFVEEGDEKIIFFNINANGYRNDEFVSICRDEWPCP
eukprot:15330649-Ditylum_brightwellii.AAC.1